MNPINIVNKFTTEDECRILIEYINNNYNNFTELQTRFIQAFGTDYTDHNHKCGMEHDIMRQFSELKDVQDVVRNILKRVKEYSISSYNDNDLEINSIWICKYKPGNSLVYHHDNDNGSNPHFKYSGVLYLNSLNSGRLEFPFRNISYKPVAGDLVMWATQDKHNGHKVGKIKEDRYCIAFWLAADQYSMWKELGIPAP